MPDPTPPAKFELTHTSYKRSHRISELLMRHAAVQYAMMVTNPYLRGQPTNTETCEPAARYIRSAVRDFGYRYGWEWPDDCELTFECDCGTGSEELNRYVRGEI
jgi:hypothetical protein